ncbi:MAG: Uma2 family endonuclease [Geodermatophilaceae bacterium]
MRHQVLALALYRLLDDACPEDLFVLAAPFAVRIDASNEVQPDVLVARRDQLMATNLPAAPVLAVEVLSPTRHLVNLSLKRAAYERMGTPSYWVLDPEAPDLLVLELDSTEAYREIARVSGGDAFTATRPFGVRVVPAALLERLGRTPESAG